jgi:prephenate dehydratase
VPGQFLIAPPALFEVGSGRRHSAVIRALDELRYFSAKVTMLGTYPADPFRRG